MDKKLWLNDKLLSYDDAHIDSCDRGFTLGDGLFETMRVCAGKVVRLEKHLARLQNGSDVIGLALPWKNDELHEAICQTLRANQLENAFVRLTVSRGVPSVRGLLPDAENANPSLVIQAGQFDGYPPELYQRGVNAIVSSIRRNEYSPLANIKSLNYLDSILAKQEAADMGADDALLLNTTGNVACASAANIFFVKGKTLLTPPLNDGALPGTMRAHVTNDIGPKHGLAVIEQSVFSADIFEMDEAFLTNALIGIMPLVSVDRRTVGSGRPGCITLVLNK